MRRGIALTLAAVVSGLVHSPAYADGPPSPAPESLTILVCRDRQDPGIGGTLVLDLARKRLVRSTNEGPTILFDDANVPLAVTPATIAWEVAHNSYVLNRATLELAVIGRIYVCQLVPRQL
ncbi:MAG TPA: hypothetical protein VG651_05330 [Stellaceae bacterium]|nr:hypothetical protein [Stellaceae bacterium]